MRIYSRKVIGVVLDGVVDVVFVGAFNVRETSTSISSSDFAAKSSSLSKISHNSLMILSDSESIEPHSGPAVKMVHYYLSAS